MQDSNDLEPAMASSGPVEPCEDHVVHGNPEGDLSWEQLKDRLPKKRGESTKKNSSSKKAKGDPETSKKISWDDEKKYLLAANILQFKCHLKKDVKNPTLKLSDRWGKCVDVLKENTSFLLLKDKVCQSALEKQWKSMQHLVKVNYLDDHSNNSRLSPAKQNTWESLTIKMMEEVDTLEEEKELKSLKERKNNSFMIGAESNVLSKDKISSGNGDDSFMSDDSGGSGNSSNSSGPMSGFDDQISGYLKIIQQNRGEDNDKRLQESSDTAAKFKWEQERAEKLDLREAFRDAKEDEYRARMLDIEEKRVANEEKLISNDTQQIAFLNSVAQIMKNFVPK